MTRAELGSPGMANAILRSNHHHNRSSHVLGLFLLLLIERIGAREFTVNWTVPTSNSSAASYGQWAESNRFRTHDSIVFNYVAGKDSVLHVGKDPFADCNTAEYLEKFSDGHTAFTFNHSGPYYFISGIKDHCLRNEKLMVIVLADRGGENHSSRSPPSPAPAPAGEASPTPPSGTVEINPTPAPASPSTPSAAPSILVSFTSSLGGAMVGSFLLLFSST